MSRYSPRRRVPERDDRRRLECPTPGCVKLLCMFHPSVTGGPVEFKCAAGHTNEVWFNTAGPEWPNRVE